MITTIQRLLKEVIVSSTDLPAEGIHTTPPQHNSARPWISILPAKAGFTSDWHWGQRYQDEHNNIVRVQKKYILTQPIMLTLEYQDLESLDKAIDNILIQLPKEWVIDNNNVSLNPLELEYELSASALDWQRANLSLLVSYAIYAHHVNGDIIKDVSLNVTTQKTY